MATTSLRDRDRPGDKSRAHTSRSAELIAERARYTYTYTRGGSHDPPRRGRESIFVRGCKLPCRLIIVREAPPAARTTTTNVGRVMRARPIYQFRVIKPVALLTGD